MIRLRKLLVTCFGLGVLPGPTGTYGSFGAAAVFVLIAYLLGPPGTIVLWSITAAMVVAAMAIGVSLGRWANTFYEKEDPSAFVLDEAAGMWLSLIAVPFTDIRGMCWVVAVQFVLFRIADIIKPAPARRSERLPDGWGIMTDDIIAAVYANIAGQIIFRIILAV